MNAKRNQVTTALLQFYEHPVAKVSLELVFSIIAVIFFALFAIRPTLVTMSDLIKEIEDKKKLDLELKQKIAALSSVQNEYTIAQDRFQVLDEAIPATPQFEEALQIIEKVASEQQLVIVSMEAKEVPKEPVQDIPFAQKTRISKPVTVVVAGDYASIRQFIENLRSTQRTLTVDSIIFNITEKQGIKQLRANITVSVHYFGKKIEPKKEAAPAAEPPQ